MSFANAVDPAQSTSAGPMRRPRRDDESNKPTMLSLVKNSQRLRGGTDAKIAAMEAKLQALKEGKGKANGDGAKDSQPASSTSSQSTGLTRAPPSAGLPKKPVAASSSAMLLYPRQRRSAD